MKFQRILALSMALVSLSGLTACANNNASGNVQATEYSVWGTDNLTSVIKETTYNAAYEHEAAKLTYAMAKGEQEYDQLIVTASTPISSIELVSADLVCGENKIGKDQIEVFMQKYVYCDDTTKWSSVMGVKDDTAYFNNHYPDMLMDMDVAVNYKENKVAANNNQGFTVRIKTATDTPAGEYKGNFTLKVDGKTEIIPVIVTVWDFALGHATGKMLTYNQGICFMNGEFDNSIEMQRKYYELCLEYDVNPQFLPGYEHFLYNQDIPGFIAEIERYWDHPNFTSYCIPNYELEGWGQFTQAGKDLVQETFLAIARASTEERNLYDRLTICHPSLDEPHINGTYWRIEQYNEIINTLAENTITQLEAEGYFNDKSEQFTEDFKYQLRHLPQVLTTGYSVEAGSKVTGWCPTIDEYSRQIDRDLYKSEAERTGGEQWFYTCNQPQYPYAGHLTHQSPVGHRALKWIQYDCDVEGYLTWFIAFFDTDELRNPYTDTQVWDLNPNGDGYFFYPGRAYNSDPFPTQKLLTYSDGQEDMDMLNMLEDLYIKVSAEYGVSAEEAQKQYDAMMGHMMDRIIDGTTNSFKGKDLLQLRKEVAQMILTLQKGELITYSFDCTTANYKVYAKSANVTINGASKSAMSIGDGKYMLSGTLDLTKETSLKVETLASVTDLFLSKVKTMANFTQSNVSVTAGSTVQVNSSEINFGLQLRADLTFEASLKIKISAFGLEKFTQMDNLTFEYTNNSNQDYVLSVLLAKNTNTMELERYNIKANSTVTISIPLIYNNQNGHDYDRVVGKTDELRFVIITDTVAKFDGKISNMTFTREG